jgi:hypothetical protein
MSKNLLTGFWKKIIFCLALVNIVLMTNACTSHSPVATPSQSSLTQQTTEIEKPHPSTTSDQSTQPIILDKLKNSYPELHQEILKLPELKQISDKEIEAIDDIVQLALDSRFKVAFVSLLDEGIKEKRKYCTPLQALLWIAYDREFSQDNPMQDYTLKRLIDEAWVNTTTSMNFTSSRWLDFNDVTDRLNSPRLVSIYMVSNISFDFDEAHSLPHRFAPPTETFSRKKGICNEQSRFALYCLLNSGYSYDNFNLVTDGTCDLGIDIDTLSGHDVCLVKEKGIFYTIDNGNLRGPFPNVVAAVDSTANRVNIVPWHNYYFRDLNLATTIKVQAGDAKSSTNETQ